jgi:pimeloyl-ACP methyl ester carboxylesterase
MEHVISGDGTLIAYERIGTGPPLILVHGTASDNSRWATLVEHIRDHFTLYVMDRRGRGESGDGIDYVLEQEYDDVAALARSIDGPVNVYGHSYGVYPALGAAPKIDNLHRLVLYEGPVPDGQELWSSSLIEELERLVEAGPPGAAISLFMRDQLRMSEADIEHYRSLPSWPARVASEPTLARELRASNQFEIDPENANKVDVPVLLLVGGESLDTFTDSVDRMHVALPNSRVKVLDGQMHSADIAAPELVASALREFLLDDS